MWRWRQAPYGVGVSWCGVVVFGQKDNRPTCCIRQ
nr:MAG TPA: hypothetical protein [Caudoviricetes sp.]